MNLNILWKFVQDKFITRKLEPKDIDFMCRLLREQEQNPYAVELFKKPLDSYNHIIDSEGDIAVGVYVSFHAADIIYVEVWIDDAINTTMVVAPGGLYLLQGNTHPLVLLNLRDREIRIKCRYVSETFDANKRQAHEHVKLVYGMIASHHIREVWSGSSMLYDFGKEWLITGINTLNVPDHDLSQYMRNNQDKRHNYHIVPNLSCPAIEQQELCEPSPPLDKFDRVTQFQLDQATRMHELQTKPRNGL